MARATKPPAAPARVKTPADELRGDQEPNDNVRIEMVARRLARGGWATSLTAWSFHEAQRIARAMPMRMGAPGRLEFYTSRSIMETRIQGGRIVHPMSIGVAEEGIIAAKALEAEGFRTLWSGGDGDPIIIIPQPDPIPPQPWFWGLLKIEKGMRQHLWPAGRTLAWTTLCGLATIQGAIAPVDQYDAIHHQTCEECEAHLSIGWRWITVVPRNLAQDVLKVAQPAEIAETFPTPASVPLKATGSLVGAPEGTFQPSAVAAPAAPKPARAGRKKQTA